MDSNDQKPSNRREISNRREKRDTKHSRLLSVLLLGAIASLTLFAYLTSFYGWSLYLELASHFQVQYFIIALILLVGLCVCRRKWFIFLGILLCTILAMQILPWYLLPQRLLPQEPVDLRVLIANVNTRNTHYEKVLDLVRLQQPDVAIFMEVDKAWKSQLDTLLDLLPYSSGQTSPNQFGLLVYSKLALNDTRLEFFGNDHKVSVITQLWVQNEPVTLVATHPVPPIRSDIFHSRNRQLDQVGQYLATVDQRRILAGDLNITLWSPYYRRLERVSGLHNARDGFGILPTWPVPVEFQNIPLWLALLLSIPIDHCLVSPGLEVTNIYPGSNTGSDHKPLIVDLRITGSELP